MRKINDLISAITSTAKALDSIKGIKLEDYQELYNKYCYSLQADCMKLANLWGYSVDSPSVRTYHVTDNRTNKMVMSSSGKRFPLFHTNTGQPCKLVNYIPNERVVIFFVFEQLEMELPNEVTSKFEKEKA